MERSLWTDERIDDRMDRIDERFDQVDARFDRVDARLDRIETTMDAGFREIRGELAAINARMFNAAVAMIAAMLSIFVALLIHTA